MKLRPLVLVAATTISAAAALAAPHIPTRYAGAFPSTANIQNITGTFTGAALALKGAAGKRGHRVSGRYACSKLSETQTRCSGSLQFADRTRPDLRHILTITWQGGRPVAMSGDH